MIGSPLSISVTAAALLVIACGGAASEGKAVSVDAPNREGGLTDGSGGSSGGSRGAEAGGASGGAKADGGAPGGAPNDELCADAAPAPSMNVPHEIGCYTHTLSGWTKVPCDCELPLHNAYSGPATVAIELSVVPEDAGPMLTGASDIEFTVDDQGSRWYLAWKEQAASAGNFNVANADDKTTVRLGASSITLKDVPLGACETRTGSAIVFGPPHATLNMRATFTYGSGAVLSTGADTCSWLPIP